MFNVIKKAKRLYYDNQITKSTNKIKTTWKIPNLETHRKVSNATTESFLNIDGIIINNQPLIADTFNNYFLSVSDNININKNNVLAQNKYKSNNDNKNVTKSNSA
jgi:hypothetical protein